VAKGKIQLYYKDAGGAEVACAKVRYRLVNVNTGQVLATGSTDARGETSPIDNSSIIQPLGQANIGTSLPFPLMGSGPVAPIGSLVCRIDVWDPAANAFGPPDYHASQQQTTLVLDWKSGFQYQLLKLRVQPYYQILFVMQNTRQPVPNAKYVGYTVDSKGRQITATDLNKKPITGKTDAKGLTPRIHSEQRVSFKFTFTGSKISSDTAALAPMVKGQAPWMYDLGAKSQVAISAPNEGKTALVDGKVSAPAVISMEDSEMLLLTPEVWKDFEKMSGLLESTMVGMHQAKLNMSQSLEGKSVEEIKQAEKNLGVAEDKIKDMLNKNFEKLADLKEVVTFESYAKGRAQGNKGSNQFGMRRRYIPKKKYEELKAKRIKGVPFKFEWQAKASVKGTAGDVSGNGAINYKSEKLDAAKLKESLQKIATSAKIKLVEADPLISDFLTDGVHQFSESVKHNENFETEKGAQWLRFVGGAGASAESGWDSKTGNIKAQVKGNLQGKLVLFEGKYTAKFYTPSSKGWLMQFGGIDLGAICFLLQCELYGFVGAKASLSGSVGIAIKGNKTVVSPQARDRGDSAAASVDSRSRLPRFEPTALNESVPKDVNGVSAEAEAFAGVEGGITPSGDLMWLPPQQKEFSSLAKLSFDVAVSAGAGASAQLHIYYANGKFRIKASARLCWGVGAKGAADFVVDAGKVMEFVKWVYYQLLHAGFKALVYIAQEAFKVLSQLLFMVISDNTQIGRLLKSTVEGVQDAFESLLATMQLAETRNKMVNNINRLPDWLRFATPETRGMLLYAITRHGKYSHSLDTPSMGGGWTDVDVHYMPSHKQAIINILAPVQTRNEWWNVMQHMTAQGTKSATPGKNEGDVARFLNNGKFLRDDLPSLFSQINKGSAIKTADMDNSYLQKFMKFRESLIGEFPKGYKVAQNGTPEFERLASLDGQIAETFAMAEPHQGWGDDATCLA
jgi:hypothetical protein